MMKIDEPVFITSDINIAGFLKVHQLVLVGVRRDSYGKCQFIFKDRQDRDDLLMDYANDHSVPVRSLLSTIRDLKGLTTSQER